MVKKSAAPNPNSKHKIRVKYLSLMEIQKNPVTKIYE